MNHNEFASQEPCWAVQGRLIEMDHRGGHEVERIIEADPGLARAPAVDQEPDVHNKIGGTVVGSVVQAHTVQGGIHVHPGRPDVVPRQLPAAVAHFAGRTGELAALTGLVRGRAATGGTVVISAVSGTAGVGKTALAIYWAHQISDRFPDGQLYVNLRGFDPSAQVMDSAEAVRRFLDALGVPPERIPVELDAQAALYRSELAGKRMLVVLDNARDTAQVRPLLPSAPTCLVVVTSRNQLTGLIASDSAHPLSLDLLTTDEARQLLVRRLGADRVAAEPAAVAEIITRCARLPLALALVAARAATQPHLGLHTYWPRNCGTPNSGGRRSPAMTHQRRAGGVLLVVPGSHFGSDPALSAAGLASRPGPVRAGRGQPRRGPDHHCETPAG